MEGRGLVEQTRGRRGGVAWIFFSFFFPETIQEIRADNRDDRSWPVNRVKLVWLVNRVPASLNPWPSVFIVGLVSRVLDVSREMNFCPLIFNTTGWGSPLFFLFLSPILFPFASHSTRNFRLSDEGNVTTYVRRWNVFCLLASRRC